MSTVGKIVGVIVAVAVAGLVRTQMQKYGDVDDKDINKALAQTVEKLNKSLPKKMDSNVTLDNAAAGDMEIRLNYLLPNIPAAKVAPSLIDEGKAALRTGACDNQDLKRMLKRGVTIVYTYTGSDGGFITDVRIKPTDCPA